MQTASPDHIFTNGELKVDYSAGCAWLGEEQLHLTPIEYKLLCVMTQNVGKVLTLSFITQKVWGGSTESDIASLRVFMATLRKKLSDEQYAVYPNAYRRGVSHAESGVILWENILDSFF